MNPSDAKIRLRVLSDRLTHVLDSNATRILEQAVAQISASAGDTKAEERRRMKRKQLWGYQIVGDAPLSFQDCEVNGHRLRVDLFCDFQWRGESDAPPVRHNLVIRVWSLEESLAFREHWDAERIKDEFKRIRRRVVARLHFDLAAEGVSEPRYHLQFGGVARDDECCWFPASINVPRLAYPPTDVVLACELVAANFFSASYRKLRDDPTWKHAVSQAQHHHLGNYFQKCHNVIQQNQSVYNSLWVTT